MKNYIAEIKIYATDGLLPDIFGETQLVRIQANSEEEAKGMIKKKMREELVSSFATLRDIYLEDLLGSMNPTPDVGGDGRHGAC